VFSSLKRGDICLAKKYWKGSTRLFSDLSWCFAVTIFLAIFNKEERDLSGSIGTTLGMFFFIFFWSWNKEHLKSRIAKTGIHILTGVFGLASLIILVLFFSNSRSFFSSYTSLSFLVINSVWSFFVFRKYIRLMWPKPKASLSVIKEK